MTHKIIVADDSQTIQKVIKITFANRGYELIPCLNEEELFSKLEDDISLILLDFSLSDNKTGYELGKEVRSKLSSTPLMALLGTFDTVDEGNFRSSGFSDKVVKPFETEKFLNKCDELIENGAGEMSFSGEEEDASGWDIQSPEIEEVAIEETSEVFIEDEAQNNELESELSGWGLNDSNLEDVTENFDQFPPVIGEATDDVSKFLSPEGLVDNSGDDLGDINFTAAEPLKQMDIASLEEEASIEAAPVTEAAHTNDSADDFWAVDEYVDSAPSEEFVERREDTAQTSNNDYVSFMDEPAVEEVQEIEVEEVSPEEYEEEYVEQEVASAPVATSFEMPVDLEERLRADLTPLVEQYVKEYCTEHIEKVAWEIIPDLAENLIKKELKQISKSVLSSLGN